MNFLTRYRFEILFSVLLIWVKVLVADHPFFWDTIQLASKHAHWFYENGIFSIILPTSINSGNPPVLGVYLAILWKIFGKSLLVSHLAIIPFLVGIVCQFSLLARKFFNPGQVPFVMLALLLEPSFITQATLISPDIILIFFFFLSINSILSSKKLWLAIAITGLGMISLRGSMLVLAILMIDIGLHFFQNRNLRSWFSLTNMATYIPVILIGGIWYLNHYLSMGWIGFHQASPWAGSFKRINDIGGFFYNVKMLIWILADHGKVYVWIVLAFTIPFLFRLKKRLDIQVNDNSLLLFLLAPLIILSPTILLFEGLMGLRYYLPVSITLILFVLYQVFKLNPVLQRVLYGILILGLVTGHLWIYPERISQSWDSTLAHLPYFELRKKMMDYVDEKSIPYKEIGSVFPNTSQFRHMDLSNDSNSLSVKNMQENKYIFYSNVFNDFKVDELEELKTRWIIEKEFNKFNVYVRLYRKPLNSYATGSKPDF